MVVMVFLHRAAGTAVHLFCIMLRGLSLSLSLSLSRVVSAHAPKLVLWGTVSSSALRSLALPGWVFLFISFSLLCGVDSRVARRAAVGKRRSAGVLRSFDHHRVIMKMCRFSVIIRVACVGEGEGGGRGV